ncbi:MAG TPA: hypothetical protein VFZ61_09560, partial [Polyangiales bacterium]
MTKLRRRSRSAHKRAQRSLHALPAPGRGPDASTASEDKRRPRRRDRRGSGRSQKPAGSGVKSWLSAIDTTLKAIERSAWRARAYGDEARDTWQRVSDWHARGTRLASSGLVLARVGAAYRLHTTKAAFVSESRAAEELDALHRDGARRLYQLSLSQGGAFLKLGQMLSSRPDLLPTAYVEELSKLQDAAPALPFAQIASALERELGRPLEQLFAWFDP